MLALFVALLIREEKFNVEIDEHFRHSDRRQTVKILGHLLDASKAVDLASGPIKFIENSSETTKSIATNLDALRAGFEETKKLCAIAMDEFKQAMTDPDARPAPSSARVAELPNFSPLQRALQREGKLNIATLQETYQPSERQRKAPKLLNFTLKTQPKKKRERITKTNIPL